MAKPFLLRIVNATVSGKQITRAPNATAQVSLVTDAAANSPPNASTMVTMGALSHAATHKANAPNGTHDPNGPLQPGKFLLVVQDAGRSPVVQRITIDLKSDALVARSGWAKAQPNAVSLDARAANVDIVSRASGKRGPPQSIITVTLFPRREWLLMSGIETHAGDGFRWRVLPESRRNQLGRSGVIGPGDLVTLLHCESRQRLTMIKGSTLGSWLQMDEFIKTGTKRKTNDFKKEPKDAKKDITILDFYACLNEAGRAAPGSVKEASIFSHAFSGGPVLFNTNDNNPVVAARNPADTDGRADDWRQSIRTNQFPNLKQAFASDGFLKLWGCNAVRRLHALIDTHEQLVNAARRNPASFTIDTLFTKKTELTTPRQTGASFTKIVFEDRVTGRHLLTRLIMNEFQGSYVLAAAQFLGRLALGALPGTGSIHPQVKGVKGAEFRMEIEPGNDLVLRFYRSQLAAADAIESPQNGRYGDYAKLLPRLQAIPLPVFSFERFFILTKIAKNGDPFATSFTEARVGSGATLHVGVNGNAPGITAQRRDGFPNAVRQGTLFIVPGATVDIVDDSKGVALRVIKLTRSSTADTGFLMLDDGRLLHLTRSAGAAVSAFKVISQVTIPATVTSAARTITFPNGVAHVAQAQVSF
jgi:hypothetical protein